MARMILGESFANLKAFSHFQLLTLFADWQILNCSQHEHHSMMLSTHLVLLSVIGLPLSQ